MLTVLCPEVPLGEPDAPHWPKPLRARLARARVVDRHRDDDAIAAVAPVEHWLARRFGLQPDGLRTVAAWRRFAEQAWSPEPSPDAGSAAPDAVLTAVPAWLQAGMDHLILHSGPALEVGAEDAARLLAAANDFLAEDGITMAAVAADCWLLHLPARLSLTLHSAAQASGRNVHGYMPGGPDGRQLRALLNSLQMLWHEHPVNQAREARGLAPVNTVWIEGAADPGRRPHCPWDHLVTDDPVLLGLARGAGLTDDRLHTTQPESVTRAAAPTNLHWARLPGELLLHLDGPNNLARLQTLMSARPGSMRVVLTGAREWIELACGPVDRLAFWRRASICAPDASRPA